VSPSDALLALLGAYLALGVLIAGWRRAAESRGDIGLWIAGLGLWMIVAVGRWVNLTPGTAVTLALAWPFGSLLLAALGALLARRSPVRGLVWLLGPEHALALMVSWVTAARLQRRDIRARGSGSGAAASGADGAQGAFASVLELAETTVGEVMIPRSEVRGVSDTGSVRDWGELVAASHHTHLAVYHGDLDEVRGYVCVKDLYRSGSPDEAITRYVREARFVPESMRCDDLLRELIAQGEKVAFVVDEFGGTAGIVRDHDLFEILLGETEREAASAPRLWPVAPGSYVADGQLRLDDFAATTSVTLPEGDYETLGGLILARLGRIPREGERVVVEGVTLEVAEATARRIVRLRIGLPAGLARAHPAVTPNFADGSHAQPGPGEGRGDR
jgi:Mg2+/Co2+ transporter CorC